MGGYPAPYWLAADEPPDETDDASPSWMASAEMRRYARPALAALWRQGLLAGVWIERLRRAPPRLATFVNRFFPVSGFAWVVRLYFGGSYRCAIACLAMDLAERLAERDARFINVASFERAIGSLPSGDPLLTVELSYRGRRYVLLPWTRLHRRGLFRQLRRSTVLHPQPEHVRWVFRRGSLSRAQLVRNLRRLLVRTQRGGEEQPNLRTWLDGLSQVVQIV